MAKELNHMESQGCCPVCGEFDNYPLDENYSDGFAVSYKCEGCGTAYTEIFSYSVTAWESDED